MNFLSCIAVDQGYVYRRFLRSIDIYQQQFFKIKSSKRMIFLTNLNKNFILYLYKNISIKFTYIIYGLVRVLISHKKIKRSLKIKTSFLAQKERFELSRRFPGLRPQQGRLVTSLSTSACNQVFTCQVLQHRAVITLP